MSRIEADRDAIRAFRGQLQGFVERQRELVDAARTEIDRTLGALHDASQRWKVTLEHWEQELYNCRREELYALEIGGFVDCSGFEAEVEYAKEHYLEVMAWYRRVQEQAAAFARVAGHLDDFLDWDFRSADHYLDDRIQALEEFLAGQVNTATLSGIRDSIWQSFRPASTAPARSSTEPTLRSGSPERGPGAVEREPTGGEQER